VFGSDAARCGGLIADGVSDPVWWPTFLVGGILFGAIGCRG
jgi:hypothetical protein